MAYRRRAAKIEFYIKLHFATGQNKRTANAVRQTVDKAYNMPLSSHVTPGHSRGCRRESPAETVNRHWLIPAFAGMTG